ncbi:MAG: MerR family DNA-binding transcriptional regulator [Thermodesulfobacteriota bacterium]
MIIFNGQTYFTIIDAAAELGVSAKTIRQYIAKGIIPEPPVLQFGIRQVKHFPKTYMDTAKERLKRYRMSHNGDQAKGQNSLSLDL